jgi:hypothetical protein
MKSVPTFLLVAISFVAAKPCLADSVGASGYYKVIGNVTMVGGINGPCGSTPCVESLDFSVILRVTFFQSDLFSYYENMLVYGPGDYKRFGPGVYSASGPLGSTWTVQIEDAAQSQPGFFIYNVSVPYSEIDAIGFNTPDGIPRSFSGPAFFYTCAGLTCADFGFQFNGTQTITVEQIPEPNSLLLMAIAGLSLLAIFVVKSQFAMRGNC